MDRRAFVFTGISLLLAIPAVILAASFVNMMQTGDVATTVAIKSDTVYYPYHSVELNFRKTLCNYIYIHREFNTVNDTGVRQDVLNTWVPTIENDFSASAGVNIDINESQINVSFDPSKLVVDVGSGPDSNGSIGITITDQDGRVVFESTLGPYSLPIYCGNPTSTSSTCEDTILLVNATSPDDGDSFDVCTNVTITATAKTDDCGETIRDGDATFSAWIQKEAKYITMTDSDADGTYTGYWLPNDTQTTDIIITATHSLNGWSGTDTISGITIFSPCGNNPPTSTITFPGNGTGYTCSDSPVTIRGTASDPDGDAIQYVEVSTDGGSSWNFANGTTNWNYTWSFSSDGIFNIKSRATDSKNATEVPGDGIYLTVTGCTLPPVSYIIFPPDGSSIACTSTMIIGNASSPNGSITYVEVSTDGGATWNNATGTTLWTYNWTPGVNGNFSIKSRAHDTWGVETPGAGITVSVSSCVSTCGNSWSSAPDVAEQFESKNNGAYKLKKSNDPASPKYDSNMGTGCNDQDSNDLKCEEKGKDIKHKRLEFTWYNATMPGISNADLCAVNLTLKYNLEKNERNGVPSGYDVQINVTNLQNGVSRLYDIPDTAEDKSQAGNWHNLTIVWPPAPTFSTNDDLTFRIQIDPQSESGWPNDDEIKLNVAECTDQVQLQLQYN